MKEKLYDTPCGTIHYWVNEMRTETALIILPGMTADHRLFEKKIEYFEEKCRVLVWDAPELVNDLIERFLREVRLHTSVK